MNTRFVVRYLGLLMAVLGASVLLTAGADWVLTEHVTADVPGVKALVVSGLIGWLFAGLLLWLGRQGSDSLGRREALLLVALSWFLGAALSGLPYYFWAKLVCEPDHPFSSFVACYFEAMSGLTTTGATVLSDIEALPTSLLLWRATTHWLGGLGIVVLFVAVFPMLGVGGKRLFAVEAPGPSQPGVKPRIRETARILWIIYLGLTCIEIGLLKLAGMTLFDSICHTFATLATGGFSTRNTSVGGFGPAIQIIMIVFMVLAGANFGLYYHVLQGRWKRFFQDPELRVYLGILLVASLLVSASLIGERMFATTGQMVEPSVGQAVLHGTFQTVSIQTTTGFCSADFNLWAFGPKAILLVLMFVGGCAGSTGGGIKVIRLLVAFKVVLCEIERVFRPNVVRSIKVGKSVIDPAMRQAVLVYILGIFILFGLGAIAIMWFETGSQCDFITAATASAATLNNIGPGLARVGAIENFGWFSSPSLIVMSLLMALGRLEVYAIAVLFVPSFWRKP